MKICEGIVIVNNCDEQILVTIGKASERFSGMIKMNDSAAYIVELLKQSKSEDDIVEDLASNFSISPTDAKKYITDVVETLKQANLVTE